MKTLRLEYYQVHCEHQRWYILCLLQCIVDDLYYKIKPNRYAIESRLSMQVLRPP